MRHPRSSEIPSSAERGYRLVQNRTNDDSLTPVHHSRHHGGARILGAGFLVVGLVLVAPQLLSPATQLSATAQALSTGSTRPAPLLASPDQTFDTTSSAATSTNWAGWAVSAGTFSSVQGSWTEPQATCPTKTTQRAAFWIGIDGLKSTDSTVEQVGSDADCVAVTVKGKIVPTATYYAWYEMYPAAAVVLPDPVAPGDVFSAQVKGSGKKFVLTINAAAPGGAPLWQFSVNKTAATAPKVSSAEWITEAPCAGSPCTILPLSDFGEVNFSKISAVGNATSKKLGFTQTELTMGTKKVVKAQPSALTTGGTAFSVTWLHT